MRKKIERQVSMSLLYETGVSPYFLYINMTKDAKQKIYFLKKYEVATQSNYAGKKPNGKPMLLPVCKSYKE